MLNHVVLQGRLGADPEIRYTQSGIRVASFNLAVERDYKSQGADKRETDWVPIVAWRNTAEFVQKYFHRGDGCTVTGRLQSRRWTAEDGSKRQSIELVADSVYFPVGGSKKDGGQPYSQPAPATAAAPQDINPTPGEFSAMGDLDDGDLPF